MVVGAVKSACGQAGGGAAAFGEGAHGHQHTAHIGVFDDGHALLAAAINRAALHTLAGVLHGLLVRALGHSHTLQADGVTGGVHHDEHVFQPTVFLADQIADSATVIAKLQHGGRAGLDAQFVLDADAIHIITRAQAAIGIEQKFRNHKQADALHPLGRTINPRQHQVDDVLSHIVLAVGDEDFGAADFVAAIGLGAGLAAHLRQVRAGLRLGQVHRACPFAAGEFFQVLGFEGIATGGEQRFNRPVGEHGAQGKAQAGTVQHFVASCAYGFGQTLAAPVGAVFQPLPAALHKLLVGLLEAGGGGNAAVGKAGGLVVAYCVQGGDHFFAELGAFFQYGGGSVQTGIFKGGDAAG